MADKIQWAGNTMPKSDDKHLGIMSLDHVKKARAFHQSFPQYTVTPLARLDGQAARLGLSNLCVKDESYRFGLNAFKVLGGSFAMANYIADETGKDVADCTFDYLTSDQLAEDFGQATFFTATDGNHGRGVAWAANKLGQKAVVHMPKGSTKPRFDNIAAEGATVTIEEVNYDECVRMAAAEADACERGVIVQDTAWEGYEKIPSWIMEGYGTMASEAAEQLREMAINRPTHVFVQAGVGSLAGAVVGYFTNLYPDNPPTFVVVECAPAACLYKGAAAGDGCGCQRQRLAHGGARAVHPVEGDVEIPQGERSADILVQQVAGEHAVHVLRRQSPLLQRQPQSVGLHLRLALLPRFPPAEGILRHRVKVAAQRPRALQPTRHRRAADDARRLQKPAGLAAQAFHVHIPCTSHTAFAA